MISRFPDWPARLAAFIAAREKRRFEFGRRAHDCCSFAFGAAHAITGYDALAAIDDYRSAEEADLILDAHPIEQFASEHFPERTIGLAQRGDIGLVVVKEELALVIVEGAELVGAGPYGLQRLPRAALLKAWQV